MCNNALDVNIGPGRWAEELEKYVFARSASKKSAKFTQARSKFLMAPTRTSRRRETYIGGSKVTVIVLLFSGMKNFA